ncbi:hypothetical protein OsI_09850 [Oryza sativa Indica Group]|uniref:Uncharacterized protein n=1 Tax=Oryza sativa subsp. indica TaxID=39946 RepID=A2XC28_ORYSI|nr:hypothetical protein OsI_09850 [Oryza sativa Indica Group]
MAFFLFFSLSFTTFLWRLEYPSLPKPGLVDGRYSGSRWSILYRMPHALHSVLGPSGPTRHCGVSVVWQWPHLFSSPHLRRRLAGREQCSPPSPPPPPPLETSSRLLSTAAAAAVASWGDTSDQTLLRTAAGARRGFLATAEAWSHGTSSMVLGVPAFSSPPPTALCKSSPPPTSACMCSSLLESTSASAAGVGGEQSSLNAAKKGSSTAERHLMTSSNGSSGQHSPSPSTRSSKGTSPSTKSKATTSWRETYGVGFRIDQVQKLIRGFRID